MRVKSKASFSTIFNNEELNRPLCIGLSNQLLFLHGEKMYSFSEIIGLKSELWEHNLFKFPWCYIIDYY